MIGHYFGIFLLRICLTTLGPILVFLQAAIHLYSSFVLQRNLLNIITRKMGNEFGENILLSMRVTSLCRRVEVSTDQIFTKYLNNVVVQCIARINLSHSGM